MNIGDVADRSGLPPKTIRYYEDIGLIRPSRSANGYRAFQDSDLHKLAFLGRARALGFLQVQAVPSLAPDPLADALARLSRVPREGDNEGTGVDGELR